MRCCVDRWWYDLHLLQGVSTWRQPFSLATKLYDVRLTFFCVCSMGYNVGKSLVEEDMVELADTLMKKAETKGVKLILPTDVVLADKFDNDASTAIASKFNDFRPLEHGVCIDV